MFLMMTRVCITLEYPTMIHSDAHFNLKAILVNMLSMPTKGPSDASMCRQLVMNA